MYVSSVKVCILLLFITCNHLSNNINLVTFNFILLAPFSFYFGNIIIKVWCCSINWTYQLTIKTYVGEYQTFVRRRHHKYIYVRLYVQPYMCSTILCTRISCSIFIFKRNKPPLGSCTYLQNIIIRIFVNVLITVIRYMLSIWTYHV